LPAGRVAKRFDLQGVSLWWLGFLAEEIWAKLEVMVEAEKTFLEDFSKDNCATALSIVA